MSTLTHAAWRSLWRSTLTHATGGALRRSTLASVFFLHRIHEDFEIFFIDAAVTIQIFGFGTGLPPLIHLAHFIGRRSFLATLRMLPLTRRRRTAKTAALGRRLTLTHAARGLTLTHAARFRSSFIYQHHTAAKREILGSLGCSK